MVQTACVFMDSECWTDRPDLCFLIQLAPESPALQVAVALQMVDAMYRQQKLQT